MTMTPLERDAILHVIEAWPLDDQVDLARTILERAGTSQAKAPQNAPTRSTWDTLYGAAAGTQEPPTDEQVTQWLAEHKAEKYGE